MWAGQSSVLVDKGPHKSLHSWSLVRVRKEEYPAYIYGFRPREPALIQNVNQA